MDNNTERLNLYDANESVSPETYSFGMVTLRRLWAILKIFFSEHLCTIFIILICLLALLEQYLVYNVGIIPSAFYKVLGDKDLNAFW
ncbi:ATP-binding cassette sub-family D member 4, partial [Stegodyphus mimosarum]